MTTVSDLYEARVRAGQLEPDAAQRGVLPALDRLVRDLGAAAPPPQPQKSGWFGKLLGGARPIPRRRSAASTCGAASVAASPC